VFLVELLDEIVDDTVVEIFTSEMGITSSRQDFKDTAVDGKSGDIKSATAQVVDNNLSLSLGLLVEAVSESCGSRFVDNTENIQASDGSGVLGGGTLVIVEIGGYGNDGVYDLLSKIGLGDFLHLKEDHGRYLFGAKGLLLAVDINLDTGLSVLSDDLEWEGLDIGLDILFLKLASDKAFLCPVSFHCG
jgi:hypothetical protein